MNQLANIFFSSKQYFLLHCLQTTMSVFVTFIQRKYPCVFWLVAAVVHHWIGCIFCVTNLGQSWRLFQVIRLKYDRDPLHKTRDFEVVISIMEPIGMIEYFWAYLHNFVDYTVRQLYNETDFILTKLEVLSMKQCMPSMRLTFICNLAT